MSDALPNGSRRRILIVEDHPLYRDGLRQFIDSQPDLICCGEADSPTTALEQANARQPDLVILDLRLRGQDGLEVLRNLRTQHPRLPILVLSQRDEETQAGLVLRAGGQGYIMKEEATEELLVAIRTVLQGDLYVSRRMSALLLNRYMRRSSEPTLADKLTDRELQVFQLLGTGLGSQQIAEQLHLSMKTVETYRENLKKKLGLPDAARLVHAAHAWIENIER